MKTMALCGVLLAVAACAPSAATPPPANPADGRDAAASPPTPTPRADSDSRAGSVPDTLVGTSWRLAGQGDAAAPASVPTLTFDTPQHVAGSTGCNRFAATVAMEGRSLRIGPLMMTRRGCPAPVMDQEKRFVGALGAVRSWRRARAESGGAATVELLDEGGAVVLKLEPVPPNEKTAS